MRPRIAAVGLFALVLTGPRAVTQQRAQVRPFDSLVLSPSKAELAQGRPSVLLITLDTTRADRMGFLGSTRGLTPRLDALAAKAIVFTRAYAQAPITTASHATILTGTYPPFHHVSDFGAPLGATVPYLPDILQHAGYATAAFVGSVILDPRTGTAPGFDRGFQIYDAGFRLRRPGEDRYQTIERRGDEVVSRASRWLTAGRDTSRPFFLWVHLFDPHDPYDPPPDLKRKFAAAPYDGEIASIDRSVGRLVDAVGRDTVIVVTADHGEALGDHGENTHGLFLYDASLRVPLVVRLPTASPAATRIQSRVRLADIAPTVLDAVGLRPADAMQGESLLPLSKGSGAADRPVYAETDYPRQAFGWSALASWRANRLLFVRAPRRELYDETADPGAAKNLAETQARVADGLDAELEQFIRRSSGAPTSSRTPMDPTLAQRLGSLGYVGGSGRSSARSAVDPKDRTRIANALHDAVVAVDDGRFQNAIPLLEEVTANEPTIQLAQLNLGVARARQRQFAAAIAPLRKAIALDPSATMAHYELGAALFETGDLITAASHFAIVAARQPQWADARYSLGSVYARIDRVADAITELRAALTLEPKHFRANLLLGRILTLQGQPSVALSHLKAATDAQPSSAEAHQFLAEAYERAGKTAEAVAEREKLRILRRK